MIYGYVVLTPRLEPTEDGFIGMGRKQEYDRKGNLISDVTAPTGVAATWG
jgi:hypothetical protein